MYLKRVHAAQQRAPSARVLCHKSLASLHARQCVQHGVEPRPEAPTAEVLGLDPQAAVPEPQLMEQPVETAVEILDRLEVLIEGGVLPENVILALS